LLVSGEGIYAPQGGTAQNDPISSKTGTGFFEGLVSQDFFTGFPEILPAAPMELSMDFLETKVFDQLSAKL